MKKILTFIIIVFLFSNCSNDDDNGIDCSLFDPVIQQLFIELVDENGDNLLENGTFNIEQIRIRFDNTEFQVVELGFIENVIPIQFVSQGENIYEIILSDTETDILLLDLSLREEICGIEFFDLETVTYNGEEQMIIVENNIEPLIRVVR